jgi:hypothetical protein
MARTTAPDISHLPALPHWDSTPEDLLAAVREVKAALRARIAASGRSVEEVFAVIEHRVRDRVDEIVAAKERGEPVWPEIDYADIASGAVPATALGQVRRRGCLVVRRHFPREQALGWDQGIVDYAESNRFFENYRGPGDDFFGSVGSRPEIYPIYWSPAQMQPVDQRIRRCPLVRPGPRLPVPGPHPPPPARHRFEGPGNALGPGHAGLVDDAGLPARVPAPVRRHGRAV